MTTTPKIATTDNLELFRELLEKEYISSLTISGKTITFTKGDGTTGTLTTQDNNTTYSAGKGISLSGTTLSNSAPVYFVTGTQTTATNIWTGSLPSGVTAYSNGLTINYYLPYAGTSTAATLNLGGLGAKNVYVGNGTGSVTTHYPAGSVIQLVYLTSLNSSAGGWKAIGYYNSNTTNTAGSTDTSSKIFLVGATSQTSSATTYSHDTAYVGTDGCLYSNNTKVSVDGHTHNYSAPANTIKALSASGTTITYTKGDGTTGTITTQDTNTTYSAGTGISLSGTTFSNSGVRSITAGSTANVLSVNTGGTTSSITVNNVANATAATTATKATQDSAGQQINTTYIKGLSVSGKTVTYTKGDGTTGTITTQDTDTHYTTGLKVGASSSATANAAASNGAVYLNVLDNATVRDSHLIKGSGATTVTSDANGVITISSTDTNTNTTYSAGTGISLSGTTFSNSGVRSVAAGSTANILSVNTGGTTSSITINNVANATNATKATQDSAGQQINTTYIKGLSASGTTITYTKGDGTTGTITTQDTNTVNTAGATDTSSKIFLVGATSQTASPQTYTHNTAYVGTDGCVYSNNEKVSVEGHNHEDDIIYPNNIQIQPEHSQVTMILNDGYLIWSNTYTGDNHDDWTGSITPSQYTGNANTATTLETARTIDGVSFDGSSNITHYGSCSTAAATAAKVVSCTGFTLATGARIVVKFTVTNTASSPTLNVNSTGAKSIYYRGSAISASYLAANRTYEFVYNGTQYELIGDLDTNTNTDTKVTNTLATTTKAYVTGTTSSTTNTGSQVFDTGIYLDTTAGTLVATTFKTSSGIEIY